MAGPLILSPAMVPTWCWAQGCVSTSGLTLGNENQVSDKSQRVHKNMLLCVVILTGECMCPWMVLDASAHGYF